MVFWTDCYKVINISNAVLKYIDGVQMESKEQYKAEALVSSVLKLFLFGEDVW